MTLNDPFNLSGKPTSRPEERKTLQPLFGSFCLSQNFLSQNKGMVERIHMEAYLDDPVKKTWTLTRVTEKIEGQKVTKTRTDAIRTRLGFTDAVSLMAAIENALLAHPDYHVQFPDVEQMGFLHLKPFAEREGYIFDASRMPHARPASGILPPDAEFNQKEIDTANKHLQRPADEFNNNGPASKLPNTHFLFDHFTLAARNNTIAHGMNELRVLDVLERFVKHIDAAEKHFAVYCKTIGQHIYNAEEMEDAGEVLKMAEFNLKQLKVYGVETSAYDSLLLQCQITSNVIHAQGLYTLMHGGFIDTPSYESRLNKYVSEAVSLFKKIDASEKAVHQLEDMIVQGSVPVVPASIRIFVDNYHKQRAAYLRLHQKPGQPPAP